MHCADSNDIHVRSYASKNRIRIPPSLRSGILLISPSYEGDGSDIGYTLTMYTQKNVKLSWIENQRPPSYREKVGRNDFSVQYSVVTGQKVTGTITWVTAGGNCTYPTFMINPQYHLSLHPHNLKSLERAKVTLTLQVGRDLPVNVTMLWSQGRRVSE